MKAIFLILDRVLETLLVLILAVMVFVVSAAVFWRYVLKSPISWGDELAAILMVWFTFLGAAVGMRDDSHYAFDYLLQSLPPGLQRVFVLLGDLLVIAISAGLLWWSAEVAFMLRGWMTPALEISRAAVYSACPVGATLILLYAVRRFVSHLRSAAVAGAAETLPEDGA